jgi:tRNA(Ile)-lysidine synthase
MSRSDSPSSSLADKALKVLTPYLRAKRWHIAFSGGMDSSVLLHLLSRLASYRQLPPLHAIHVHHGLLKEADDWVERCQQVCKFLQIPLSVEYVQVDRRASLERAARDARYAAFARHIEEDEVLLVAQHQDDQAETLLLRLLRGAGVKGLSAMATSRAMPKGHLIRPFLLIPREELLRYALAEGLEWVEDPSNQQVVQDRNFLRHEVLKVLRLRWPQASNSIARSAGHMAEALAVLEECAAMDLSAAQTGHALSWLSLPSLELEVIKQLSDHRQRNALRHWLDEYSRMPDTDHWAGWVALRDATVSANPVWALEGGEMHRGAGRLWWVSRQWLTAVLTPLQWPEGQSEIQLGGNGQARIIGQRPEGVLDIRYRQGGEVMMVSGRGHRDLKRLLNEHHVPTFLRGRLPLLFCNGQLIAVANLSGLDSAADKRWRFEWTPATSGRRLS